MRFRCRRFGALGALIATALVLALPAAGWADSEATTQPATSVTFTSAQLNGIVNATNPDSSYAFQYGTSTSYGQLTPVHSIGTGSQQVSETITNLTPATTYHFRLLVQNGSYTPTPHTGDDMVFTTPALNSVATTGNATSVTDHSAQLNGVVNTSNPDSAWSFQYGTSTSYSAVTHPQAVGAGVTVVATTITGLQRNTTYHFRLVVVQGSYPSTQSTGTDVTFTTSKFPPGRLSLRRRHLRVHHARVAIPLKCSGAGHALCKGRVSLTAKTSAGTSIRCAGGHFSVHAVRKFSVQSRVRGGCLKLLRSAKRHRLKVTLVATLAANQGGLTRTVVLFK